jgi:hypothetical protein
MTTSDDKAAAPAAPAAAPPAAAPAAPGQPGDLAARIRAAENELAALRSQAHGTGTVLLRVEDAPGKPYALIRGGYTIGTDPVPVPQRDAGMLLDAAADAGVNLLVEEG